MVLLPAATWITVLYATAADHWIEGCVALLLGSLLYAILSGVRRRRARATPSAG